jgi:hypothetical protein
MINQVKYYIFAILLLGSFLHQVKELTDKFKKQESSISATLENKLQELKANERIIEREKLKIIDRPVYNNTCLDTDGVQLLNKQRSKQDPSTGKSTN